jgi:succinate-semialdehyde dehydrogenase / glutarate-semialdehyde dehydrogenase
MPREPQHVRNPRNGALDYSFTPPDDGALDAIATRLRGAQKGWAGQALAVRAAVLQRFGVALSARAGEVAAALEVDSGRCAIAMQEVRGVIGSIMGWAAQAPHLLPEGWTQGRSMPSVRHAPQFVPYGLVGVISPWNFPLTLSMIDTIPALLAGCAVIVKPSEVTPRFVEPLEAIIADIPELAAVLAFAPGDGLTGMGLIDRVDAICFTGSVPTGRKVALQAAGRLIPSFLELGGKDPLIITETADLDHAVTAALRGSVLSTGQACQSIERIYVQRSISAAFVEKLVAAAQAVRLNADDITKGELGPIIFERQAATFTAQIADAVAKGAKICTGGTVETHNGGGLWLAPTVITDVDHSMAVMTEETFGPLLPVMAYDSIDDAINLANDGVYGLSGAVFAGTLEEAEAIGRQLDVGGVSLNDAALTALFYEAEKHAFKESGLGGSRMGPAGFQRFLRKKALMAQTGAPVPIQAFAEDA